MRVTSRHTSAIDGHEPGASFDVDPDHAAWAPLLRGGYLVPATANDVRFGANDPPPSPEAVRGLVAGVNARNREIVELHAAVEAISGERDGERAKALVLQQRVNELEAILAMRPGAPTEGDAIRAAVSAAEEAITKRFDAAYARLEAENTKLRADVEALTAPAPKPDADAPADKAETKTGRTTRQG